MPEKQQIIPVQVAASCETYNCLKKAKWAIGRPDGPRQLWHYHCDQCMRDIVANIPTELIPVQPEQDDVSVVNGYIALTLDCAVEVAEALPDGELKAQLIDEINATLDAVEEAKDPPEVPEQVGKTYACDYCGESFASPQGKASHTRYCKAKKEAAL